MGHGRRGGWPGRARPDGRHGYGGGYFGGARTVQVGVRRHVEEELGAAGVGAARVGHREGARPVRVLGTARGTSALGMREYELSLAATFYA